MPAGARKSLKVVQLSDCHVSADASADYRGQNADRRLESLLPSIMAWSPDLLLLTGDVSEDASTASYRRVSAVLNTIGVPVLALPGNHDEPDVMKHHFPLGPWAGPYVREAGRWSLVLMDSTVTGRISGFLGRPVLKQLQTELADSKAEFVLLALHHQPAAVNAPWIDRYALENPEDFFRMTDHDPRIRCIVWGHVHHDFQGERKGVVLLGAPSTVANSLPQTQRFTLDPAGPACRWLELGEDGRLKSGVLRPPQSSTGNTNHRIR